MIWLWILGVILALLLLLLMTRVGVLAAMREGELSVRLRLGLFRFQILPAKKKNPKKEKTQKTTEEKPKEKSKIAFADIKDAIKTLWQPLKRALDRTRRGVRIHPLTVSLTVGAADDPAAGAELYGYLQAGVWTAMPVLEQLLVIPEPAIHIGIDFDAPRTAVEGEIGLSARVGTLLRIVLTIAIPALRWYLRWKKKTEPAASETQAVQ